jgi:YegS/Rv2252/BmrU family lipid kinase
MKVLVVVNPIAGGGAATRGAERVVQLLERRGHAVECFSTRSPEAAGERVRKRELEGDLDRIVVAGGDGTVNDVLNGLEDPSRIPLAHLAYGTANMLARELCIPRDPRALAALVERGAYRRLDLGRAGSRRFLLVVSSGFDATVTRAISRTRRGTLGYPGYAKPILGALRQYRAPRLRVGIDGAEPLSGALVIASNIRNYGGIFSVADRARPDSGVLDVCVFSGERRLDLLRYAFAAGTRRVSRLPDVAYRTGRRIVIEAREPTAVQIDGDYRGTTPLTLEVDASVVPILTPLAQAAAVANRWGEL